MIKDFIFKALIKMEMIRHINEQNAFLLESEKEEESNIIKYFPDFGAEPIRRNFYASEDE